MKFTGHAVLYVVLFYASSRDAGAEESPTVCESQQTLDGGDEVSLLQTSKMVQDTLASKTQETSDAVSQASKDVAVSVAKDLAVSEATVQKTPLAPVAKLPPIASADLVSVSKSPPFATTDFVVAALVFSVTLIIAYLLMSSTYVIEMPEPKIIGKLSAEFCGTFILVFTVSCTCIAGNATWNPTAVAAVLMAMIYATGPISGGNLNPAVSIALYFSGKMPREETVQYCAVQILGGIMATFTASLTLAPIPSVVAPVEPYTWYYAVAVEMIYTAVLCFVVLNCAASKKNNPGDDPNQFFALAIGLVVIAGGYPCGHISGAHFNPAVSLGLEMMSGAGLGWGFVWVAFQCVGSAIAVVAFCAVRPEEFSETVEEGNAGKECFAEFLGTYVLAFTVGLNIVTGSGATAWSAAASLMCMIYSLGDVSGAHFNPAVSVAIVAAGRDVCSFGKAILYIVVQCIGAVTAGALIHVFHTAGPKSSVASPLAASTGHTPLNAGIGEMLFTLLLAYVVLATATTKPPASQKSSGNYFFGFCIGACVMVGGTSLGSVSGGELNPAVCLGVYTSNALYSGAFPAHAKTGTSEIYLFPLLELCGGLLAAIVFRLVHMIEYDDAEKPSPSVICKCLAEFLGTFYLVLTVGFVSLGGSGTWNALAIALVLTVMIYSTASVSGANLNPAVSLTLAICKQLDLGMMFLYWLVQICGGIAAGFTFSFIFHSTVAIQPHTGYSWDQSGLAEVIYTTMLCFVVLQSAVSKGNNPEDDGNQFFAMAIGFVIIAGGYAVGSISGACFNPAVSLGLSVSHEVHGTGPSLFYWSLAWSAFQFVGSALAAFLFAIMRPQDIEWMKKGDDEVPIEPKPSLMVKCLSEFLGVFILVMTVGLNVVTKSPATALSAAGALMCSIYSLGYISGAHLNPAVTLAVFLSGRNLCTPFVAIAYALSQSLAAVLAGHLYAGFHIFGPNKMESFPLLPGKGYGFAVAGVSELFFTGVLAYTVLAVATSATASSALLKKTQQCFYFGIAIAACVIAGGFAIGGISGGELNPAVSLGISVANLAKVDLRSGHQSTLASFVPFSLWQLSGGIIASIIFRVTHNLDFTAEQKSI